MFIERVIRGTPQVPYGMDPSGSVATSFHVKVVMVAGFNMFQNYHGLMVFNVFMVFMVGNSPD